MRITHQMLSRNYLKRMNTNLSNLTGSNEKMSSQRAFNKAHENVSDAGKALKTRKLIADNERYQTNVRDALGRATAAEDGLRTVNGMMITAKERLVQGLNGTLTQEDRQKIASEMEAYQNEVFMIMNNSYSEQYIYSASGNQSGTPPFTVDASGKLLYNGTPVDDMVEHPDNGRPAMMVDDGYGNMVAEEIPWNVDNYIDIGFGYTLNKDQGSAGYGKVNANTAFQDSFSGVQSFGFGTDEDGIPLNAWSLFGKMVDDLNSNNIDGLRQDLNAIPKAMEYLLTSITSVGARYVTLEDTKASLENEYVNLAETQNELEGVDLAEEIIFNKNYEMSWMVTLQLGSKILPQTIFDFIR